MITLENKATSIAKNEKEFATYADLIVAILNKPLSKTIDIKSMRRDLKLLDIFDTAGETVELTKPDFDYVASLIDESEWAIKHKDIVTFVDYIDSLKQDTLQTA